jgi:glutathione S-transferase
MKMRLFLSLTSPYARKVRVVVRELGLSDLVSETLVDPWNAESPNHADLVGANPLCKVPTLVTDKGEPLPDSRLIVEYLLGRGRGLASLPRGAQRWALLRRQQLADGILDDAVARRREEAGRPAQYVFQGSIDRHTAAINRSLDALDADAGELLHEGPVRTVEISVGVALGYLDLRFPQLAWREGRERLARWYHSFSQRPSMLATQPPAGT